MYDGVAHFGLLFDWTCHHIVDSAGHEVGIGGTVKTAVEPALQAEKSDTISFSRL